MVTNKEKNLILRFVYPGEDYQLGYRAIFHIYRRYFNQSFDFVMAGEQNYIYPIKPDKLENVIYFEGNCLNRISILRKTLYSLNTKKYSRVIAFYRRCKIESVWFKSLFLLLNVREKYVYNLLENRIYVPNICREILSEICFDLLENYLVIFFASCLVYIMEPIFFICGRRNIKNLRQAKKILLIRQDHIGDVVLSFPAFKAVRKFFPESHISCLLGPWTQEVIFDNKDIDELVIADAPWHNKDIRYKNDIDILAILRLGMKMFLCKFDLAISFRGDARDILISYLSGAKFRIDYSDWYFPHDLLPRRLRTGILLSNKKIQRNIKDYMVEQNLLLLKSIGVTTNNSYQYRFTISDMHVSAANNLLKKFDININSTIVAIQVDAGSKYRYIPNRLILAIIKHLARVRNMTILLLGKDENMALTKKISIMRLPPHSFIKNLINKTSLFEIISLMTHLKLFVCSDTGTLHIASLMEIPTVAIFGPGRRDWYMPRHKNCITIFEDMPCSPCGDMCIYGKSYCLEFIKKQKIFSAIDKLMATI